MGNDGGIVHIRTVHQHKGGVVVDEIIQLSCSHSEGSHGFPTVKCFFPVVDHTSFNQLHHTIGDHFGVDAQIIFFLQEFANRVRQTADTQLQGRSVFYQICAIFAQRHFHIRDHRTRDLDQWVIARDKILHLTNVHKGFAMDAGHIGVDLHNADRSAVKACPLVSQVDAQ